MRMHCKTYHRGDLRWQKQREIDFLKKLDGIPHFPDLVAVDSEGIYITYCGEQFTPENVSNVVLNDVRQQFEEILTSLKRCGIRHRDITTHNVLWMDGVLSLIDFGWSTWEGEDDTPQPVPGVMREGFMMTDRERVQQIIERLEGWVEG